jgi:hypothetical protein
MPMELQAKSMAANTKNLPNQDDLASKEFDKRVKIADLMLKESDIKNKAKIVEMQMMDKQKQSQKDNDFLKSIIGEQ